MSKHILVVGCGSIGKRHARNLSELGCQISGVDPREDRQQEFSSEVETLGLYSSYQKALEDGEYDGLVIGSPTAFHVDQSILALEKGIPVLLEKPVSKTIKEARKLLEVKESTGTPLLLGYTWRWWKPLQRVYQLLDKQEIGTLRHVQFYMSAHLADWHPWEPYQEFFMSSKEKGGGALLDESHWIDLMLWFFGSPDKLYGHVEKISDLEIDSDDNVDIIVTYKNGPRVYLHLDLYGRPHEKFIRFIGDKGTILWSVDPNRVAIGRDGEQVWEEETFTYERNDMFIGVSEEFMDLLSGSDEPLTCTLQDGIRVMEIIEAVRKSQSDGHDVMINKKEFV